MPLFPVFDGRRYGYANERGDVVIPPRFTKIPIGADSRFVDGLALAHEGSKSGFIGENGDWVLEPRWDGARPFSDGLAAVATKVRGGLSWTYVSRDGAVLPGAWWRAGPFAEGRAFVEREPGGGFELVDREGRAIGTRFAGSNNKHDLTFRGLPFAEGMAAACDAETRRWGFVDRDGAWALPPAWKSVRSFSEGLATVQDDANHVIFVDRDGKEALRYGLPYLAMASFSEGLVLAPDPADSLAKAYLDRTGAVRIPAQRGHVGSFSHGRALYVLPSGGSGFIDPTGHIAIPPTWAYAEAFLDGLARVVADPNKPGRFGYIDATGRLVIPPLAKN